MTSKRYVAFVSYSSRYREWVGALHRNLERCLSENGESREVFLDQTDLGAGRSWVAGLQAGLDNAEHLVLVVTPEALASPRVADEYEAFVSENPNWTGRLVPLLLVDTPLPPFLSRIHVVDFEGHDGATYRQRLGELGAALLGRNGQRDPLSVPDDVEIPAPPDGLVPKELRREIVGWLAPLLKEPMSRIAVAHLLDVAPAELEGYPSWKCAASAVLVKATGDDDPVSAARRFGRTVQPAFTAHPSHLKTLRGFDDALAALDPGDGEGDLLRLWRERVRRDHSELLPFFEPDAVVPLLEEVYVQLQLQAAPRALSATTIDEHHLGPMTLPEVLELDAPWVTRRWVVLGDPGSGKTTLLRHLAAELANPSTLHRVPSHRVPSHRVPSHRVPSHRVPVFEGLPRLMREREWLLDRIEHHLCRAGSPARGLAALLEGLGKDGRLVLLLDGLDEVPRENRDDAEALLRDLSARWPRASIVVTSRPIGYRRPATEFHELEVQPFDDERRRRFLERWLGRAGAPGTVEAESAIAVLEQDRGLRDLAGNPLYLTLMALLMEQGTSPERHRTGLYDQVFQLLLDGKHRGPRAEPMEAQAAVRQVLRHLAREMTRANRDAEPVTSLEARLYKKELDALREPLELVPRWNRGLSPFFNDLAEHTGILGPHDGPDTDWRYWHRTFREALTAESLEATLRAKGGEAQLLAEARTIAQANDLSRWAEPYALLTGRVDDPDSLVRTLVEENRALGLRALANARGLRDETVRQILALSHKWQERAKVYARIPELLGDPEPALTLIDQLRQRTQDCIDLFHLERTARAVGEKWQDASWAMERLLERFYDHLPAPPKELFQSVETPIDGRVALWAEIPSGIFRMGSPESEAGRQKREGPQHEVRVTSSFRLAVVPVTVAQFRAFDPDYRSYFQDWADNDEFLSHPADSLTWYQAVTFCRWLSTLPGLQGARLPTEEEWEYTCRAGSTTAYWNGAAEKDLGNVGWFSANSGGRSHGVGEKPANPWGLYDVHGNVWEWTATIGKETAYKGRDAAVFSVDPAVSPADLAADPGDRRVFRGGSYALGADWARCAFRNWLDPAVVWIRDRGFRVLVPSPPADP